MPSPELILFPRLAGADQIAQSFMSFVGNPHRSQIPGTMAARQFFGVTAIRLDPVPDLNRNQRGSNYLTIDSQSGQLPIENIPSRSGFVAGAKIFHRPQFPYQFSDRLQPVRNRSY
jgi:hypothetical protein